MVIIFHVHSNGHYAECKMTILKHMKTIIQMMITIYDDHHTYMKTIILNSTIIATITAGSYAVVEEELP